MRTFAQLILKFRVIVILFVLGITGFLGVQTLSLGINADLISYLPADRDSVKLHKEIGNTFGGNDLIVAAIHPKSGDLFSHDSLEVIRKLTRAYENASLDGAPVATTVLALAPLLHLDPKWERSAQDALQDVAPLARNVISLTNTLDIRSIEGGVEVKTLVSKGEIPEDGEALSNLRDYTLSKDMYNGQLVSANGKYAGIVIRLRGKVDGSLATQMVKDITEKIAPQMEVHYAGVPVWNNGLTKIIFYDMKVLIPIVAFLVILILFFSFRSWRGVLLPLATVVMSTVWTMGIMSLVGAKLTMISNVIPVLLIAVGSAYGIHLLNHYRENITDKKSHHDIIVDTLANVGAPILLAGVTTFVGFLSFLTAYLTLARDFGIFSAVGVGCALFLSLTFIPAVLAFLKPSKALVLEEGNQDRSRLVSLMERVAHFTVKRRRPILVIALILSVVSGIGIQRITRNVNMVEYFKRGHPIREGDIILQQHLGGATPLQVQVKGDIKDPFVLKQMLRIEKYMAAEKNIQNAQSMASFIAETHHQMYGKYKIPDTREKVVALWLMLEGQKILEQMVTPKDDQALVQGTIAGIDSYVMIQLANRLEAYLTNEVEARWKVVDRTTLDDAHREEVEAHLQERVSEMVTMDLKAALGDIPNGLDIDAVIAGEFRRDSQNIDMQKARSLALVETMMAYVTGDEAELEPETDEELDALRKGFTALFQSPEPTLAGIKKVLVDSYNPEVIEEDPEAIEEMAANMLRFGLEALQKVQVERATQALVHFAPADLVSPEREWLTRDLEGDLWELHDRYVAIPEDDLEPAVAYAASGMPRIYRELDESLVSSQLQSLAIAFLVVLFMLSIQFGSLWAGILGCIPIAFTVLLNFAVMAYAGIPLDMSTVLIASLAIGIGIDYTIHYMSRLRTETRRHDDLERAVTETTRTTGSAIAINSVSVAAGFSTLLAASLIPMMHFGWMTAMTMIVSALAALLLIPAVVLSMKKTRFLRRLEK